MALAPRFAPPRRAPRAPEVTVRAVQFASAVKTRAQRAKKRDRTLGETILDIRSWPSPVVASIWPGDDEVHPAASTSTLDRVDRILQATFQRSKWCVPRDNPPLAVRSFYYHLDSNKTGKLDRDEFQSIFYTLGLQHAIVDDKKLTPAIMDHLFKRYDIDRSGCISVEEFGQMLFKRGPQIQAKAAIARVREVLSLRAGGFESISAMGRAFRHIDKGAECGERAHTINRDEFNLFLQVFFRAYNVTFTTEEKEELFAYFDRDRSGLVDYDEFIRGLRGDMGAARRKLVALAFASLPQDRQGRVTRDSIETHYSVDKNPGVVGNAPNRSGGVSREAAIHLLLDRFDLDRDGMVTLAEFTEAYQDVSASFDSDLEFELMIRNAWHLAGGEGACAETASRRVLVELRNGIQRVVTLRGLDWQVDAEGMRENLAAQGIPPEEILDVRMS